MREIKLRAWDGNQMYVPTTFDVLTNGELWAHRLHDGQRDSTAVMQYTGFKDKNGIDIYEGDVVEFLFLPDQKTGRRTRASAAVSWDSSSATYKCNLSTASSTGFADKASHSTITGHIYESTSSHGEVQS